jgi:hypothetical protein
MEDSGKHTIITISNRISNRRNVRNHRSEIPHIRRSYNSNRIRRILQYRKTSPVNTLDACDYIPVRIDSYSGDVLVAGTGFLVCLHGDVGPGNGVVGAVVPDVACGSLLPLILRVENLGVSVLTSDIERAD